MGGEVRALSGVRSDYIVSSLASASVALSSVLMFAWVGRTMGADELGFFSQIRRVSAMWVPVGSVGVSIALSRYIPRLADVTMIRRRALQTLGLVTLILILHMALLTQPFAVNALGPVIGPRLTLVWPFLFQLCGLCILVLPYAMLRGLHRIRWAAVLQVVGYALWPLLCIAWDAGANLELLVTRMGCGQLVIGLVACLTVLGWTQPAKIPTDPEPDPGLRVWLSYGLARLPGGIFGFVLWAGVPMVLLRAGQPAEAALANAVTSLVNLPVMVLSPLSFVLLPRLSLAQVQGEEAAVQAFVRRGLRAAWELQLPLTLGLVAFLEPLLGAWLGFEAGAFVHSGRWMILAIPAVTVFLFCRPTVDARSVVPYAVIAQGLGALCGVVYCLGLGTTALSQTLGQAFFVAQSAAALFVVMWCYRLHAMKRQLPFLRLLLQGAPLVAVTVLVLLWGTTPWTVLAWSLGCLAYACALYGTASPVALGALALVRKVRS